jgi:sigma-B regulation protein RsbU (phosphoserine phosphatase)
VNDPDSIAAHVFREQAMLVFDDTVPGPRRGVGGQERDYKGGSFVSLPITYAPPGGALRRVGVINLTDRIGADAFTASHKRLLAAVASEVGAAIENARLVESERHRVRMDTELALAHELQAALMQPASALAEVGDIGARTQSADAVGGDFYRVVSLRSGALGVMFGDVSSHGLTAAMIMAHAIAAAGFVAQTSSSAEHALERLLEVIGDELRRTEMHVALFYGIVDGRHGVLRYANAGHPQAFLLRAGGREVQRLEATAPPLGLGIGRRVGGASVAWRKGEDILCLFTDGISETANAAGERFGEARLLAAVGREAARPAREIVDAVFRDLERFGGAGAGADDRTLVVLRG